MKKMSAVAIGMAVLGFASSASAADMAARPYKAPPPVVAPIYDWTGFYIGANGGWGNSHNCWDFVTVGGAVVGNAGAHGSDIAANIAWAIGARLAFTMPEANSLGLGLMQGESLDAALRDDARRV